MKTPEIKVYVVGYANSGKSAVAELLAASLEAMGIQADVKKIFNEEPQRRDPEITDRCLEQLKERGLKVSIQEVQSQRELPEGIRRFYHVG